MKKKGLKAISTVLAIILVLSMVGCGKSSKGDKDANATPTATPGTDSTGDAGSDDNQDTDVPKEVVTIRYGTHYEQGLNPHYVDEVTGEYTMPEAEREARIAAEEAILDELGVVFEYVQYPGNTNEVLMQSVMANDPISDIAWMWGGSEGVVLAQNVLQQLDQYTYIFEDEEVSWMLYDPIFGHNYFLGAVMRFNQRWPLVYNISYIEAVDSLKDENGDTIYPTELYEKGEWTWSTFKDYLAKIETFYANSSAPNRPERRIDAYQTDYRFAALSAVYSNGGSIYGVGGLEVNSEATKEAVAYIKELMDAKILTCETYADSISPGWTWNGGNFQSGESVFTDIPDWFIEGAATQATERGESIGIVPWPRPDDMSIDDENYRQVLTVSDSIGILKGVSPEKTELALKALALYYKTYYTTLADVDTIAEVRTQYAEKQAAAFGFDIFHEKIGDSILSVYQTLAGGIVGNDYSDLISLRGKWDEILGNSLYGVNGTASYDVAIEANMSVFDTVQQDMMAVLSSEGVYDNIKPSITTSYDAPLAIPEGTAFENVEWADYIIATDNVDGTLDISTMQVTPKYEYDLNVVGLYEGAFDVSFTDSSGNTETKSISFVVYNPENKTAPTVTLVSEPAPIAVDANASEITWKGNFIESAVDADGLDVSRNIKTDLSTLDTTTPGTYTVEVTVTDFAGNETIVSVDVVVGN